MNRAASRWPPTAKARSILLVLLDAQRVRSQAQELYFQALYDYQLAIHELERAAGIERLPARRARIRVRGWLMENDRELTETGPSRSAQANGLRMKVLAFAFARGCLRRRNVAGAISAGRE